MLLIASLLRNQQTTHSTLQLCKFQSANQYRHEFDTMNALAWVECFLPVFLWVGNCVFNNEGDRRFKLAGTALCGLLSLIAGPMYLTWFYQCKSCQSTVSRGFSGPQPMSNKPVKMQKCFKAHVSLCLGCVILGIEIEIRAP